MKGKLIAVAVAGAFVAPAAMAQMKPVAGFEWNVYGRVYLTMESVEAKGGTGADVSRRTRLSDNSSLLGIRAEKDLGRGLRGWGQLETAFAADQVTTSSVDPTATTPQTVTSNFADRNSGVGLMGDFGNFFIGRWDMPFKISQVSIVDPFGDLTIGDITGVAMRQGGFSNRANNSVHYWSPSFSGLMARVAMTSNETKVDGGANPKMYGASLEWTTGPFYAAYGYEKHKDSTGNLTATQGTDETGHGISGKYTMGGTELMAQIGQYDRTGTEKQKSWALGVRATFGVHQLLAAYRNSQDGGNTGTTQPECYSWAAGYRYLFDRNFDFIAEVTKVTNKTGSSCNFGQNALTISSGQDPQGVAAGFRYTF